MGNTPIVSTAIGLGLETGTFTAKADAAAVKLNSMTKSFERDLSRTKTATESFGKSAGGSFDLATRKIDGLGGALRGAQPAIAGMQKGLDLLGSKAPPALSGIANAAISLMSGGFTPLGLAIAAATGAMAIFSSQEADSTKQSDEHTKALERQKKALDDITLARRASQAGNSPEVQGNLEALGPKSEELRRLTAQGAAMLRTITARENELAAFDAQGKTPQNDLGARAAAGDLQQTRNLYYGIKSSSGDLRGSFAKKGLRDRIFELDQEVASLEALVGAQQVQAAESLKPKPAPTLKPYKPTRALGDAIDDLPTMSDSDLSSQTQRIKHAREMLEEEQAAFVQKAHGFGAGGMNIPSSLSAWDANSAYGDEPAKLADAWERQAVEIKRSTTFLSGFEDQLRRVNVEASRLDTVGASVADSLTTGIGDGLVDALDAAAQGTAKFGEAFSSMAESVIADTGRIIVRQLLLNAISGAVSSAFGVSTPTAPAKPPAAYAGGVDPEAAGANWQWGGAHANGGSYTVRGYGGVDSQLVAFKATPGERVDFTPPGRAGGGGVEVHVHNHSGQPVQQKRSRRAGGGERWDLIIGKMATAAVAADFANGGEAWQALERNAGARRTSRRG